MVGISTAVFESIQPPQGVMDDDMAVDYTPADIVQAARGGGQSHYQDVQEKCKAPPENPPDFPWVPPLSSRTPPPSSCRRVEATICSTMYDGIRDTSNIHLLASAGARIESQLAHHPVCYTYIVMNSTYAHPDGLAPKNPIDTIARWNVKQNRWNRH